MELLIISEITLFRKGLGRVVAEIKSEISEMKVSEAASTGELPGMAGLSPDVIVVGYSILKKRRDVRRQLSVVSKIFPEGAIVVLEDTAYHEVGEQLLPLLQSGALGYLSFKSDAETISACIDAVYHRKRYLPHDIVEWLVDSLATKKYFFTTGDNRTGFLSRLTKNEMEIATMLSEGEKVTTIARKTGRQTSTVSTIKRSVMRKTNSNNIIKLREFLMTNRELVLSGKQ